MGMFHRVETFPCYFFLLICTPFLFFCFCNNVTALFSEEKLMKNLCDYKF